MTDFDDDQLDDDEDFDLDPDECRFCNEVGHTSYMCPELSDD